jgi:hypothetical protein
MSRAYASRARAESDAEHGAFAKNLSKYGTCFLSGKWLLLADRCRPQATQREDFFQLQEMFFCPTELRL